MSQKNQPHPKLDRLLKAVCAEYGVTVDELRGRHHGRALVAARREFCIRAWALHIFSGPTIGGAICRDHTTVMYHCGLLKNSKKKSSIPNRSFLPAVPASAVLH